VFRLLTIGLSSLFLLSACASGTFKARQDQREKIAAASGLYCEFVNGDKHPDVDVELNMQMSKRCDSASNFSITNYRNSSDQNGVVYCCAMQGGESKAVNFSAPKKEKAGKSDSAPSIELPAPPSK